MICPICDYNYSEQFKFLNCENFDNSYLYKDICIHKCNKCGHIFNVLNKEEKENLRKYYKKEHTLNTISKAYSRQLKLGINDAYSIPFEDNSFDEVILDQVLEHLTNPRLTLKEVRRVLDKSGYCYINVPDAERYNDLYFYIMREHVQHFTLNDLKLLTEKNGFELITYNKSEVKMIGTLKLPNLAVVLKVSSRVYCWGIGREFMYLYPNTRLRNLDLILVDDIKQKKTFKGMKIHGSDILKEADKNSFLIITATVHKELLKKKAKELGYKGEIIDI